MKHAVPYIPAVSRMECFCMDTKFSDSKHSNPTVLMLKINSINTAFVQSDKCDILHILWWLKCYNEC